MGKRAGEVEGKCGKLKSLTVSFEYGALDDDRSQDRCARLAPMIREINQHAGSAGDKQEVAIVENVAVARAAVSCRSCA